MTQHKYCLKKVVYIVIAIITTIYIIIITNIMTIVLDSPTPFLENLL